MTDQGTTDVAAQGNGHPGTKVESVYLETSSGIRHRERVEILERERNFWQKTAEQLQDQLDRIFDAAKDQGHVMIIQRGNTIKLVKAPNT